MVFSLFFPFLLGLLPASCLGILSLGSFALEPLGEVFLALPALALSLSALSVLVLPALSSPSFALPVCALPDALLAAASAAIAFALFRRVSVARAALAADFSSLKLFEEMPSKSASSFELLTKAAESGDPEAQYHLGWAYDNGRDTQINKVEAAVWYAKAAKNGHKLAEGKLKAILEAQGVLEIMRYAAADAHFGEDLAVLKDLPEVLTDVVPRVAGKSVRETRFSIVTKDLLAGAKNRVPGHMFNLGIVYDLGLIPQDDPIRATRWHRRAAELGHVEAQNAYGRRLLRGQGGLKKDLKEACKWLSKAAEKDFLAAMLHLWEISREAPSLVSPEEGLDLLFRSAEAGWPDSEFHL